MNKKGIYKSPAFMVPSTKTLAEICSRLGMDADECSLSHYQEAIGKNLPVYDVVDSLPEPSLPVKYPRLPGYCPEQEENPLNAWYWRCNIQGASSGKLSGKKVAIKDSVCVAGVPMMNGSRVLEGYVPEFDATVVTRILDAGGAIVGKSTCEHFCYSSNSFNSDKGPVLNPHDNSRSAGGSSSGSAALVTVGEVDMAIGGDQGGSVRMPASCCGIVGLKPTYGLVPYTGAMGLVTSFDHLGPMAQTVYDCALMLEVIAGYDDGLDNRQKPTPDLPKYTHKLTGDLNGVKVGVVKEGFVNADKDVEEMVRAAANSLQQKGATVQEISVPMHDTAYSIWAVFGEGAYTELIDNYGHPVDSGPGFHATSTIEAMAKGLRCRINDLSSRLKLICVFGEYMKESYNHRFYHKAANLTRTARAAFDDVLKGYDVMVMPTLLNKPAKLPSPDIAIPEFIEHCDMNLKNTAPYNLTGHPAISINAGFSEGLPIGMMIVGRHFEDEVVLNVAYAYEQIREEHNKC